MKSIRNEKAMTFLELVIVITIIGILSSFLLPRTLHHGMLKKRASCMNNLKQIGLALHMYSQDYGKWFPASEENLMNLYPDYIRKPIVFWCPEDNDPEPVDITNAVPNGINSCQVSYRYYPGFDETDNPRTIMAEDNSLQNHNGEGINRLYLNGHVKWVKKKNLEEK